jgi:hypothetical protein
MADSFLDIHGVCVYQVSPVGPELRSDKDAVHVMSASAEQRAEWIAIPIDRLGDDFFELRTRIAGEMLQKFTMYGKRVVILGDIAPRTAASRSLAAFVAESNRGQTIWFLPSLTDFENRLSKNPAETS